MTGTIDNGTNILVRKYDADGNEIWTDTYSGSGDGYEVGEKIIVDGEGNAYVTGYIDVEGQGSDLWIRKYDMDGNEIWTATYNGSSNGDDEGHGIALDDTGNVYVAGTIRNLNADIWFSKFTPDGDQIWAQTYDEAGFVDSGNDIAIDNSGNVYVTGSITNESNRCDSWIGKYNPEGIEIWRITYDGDQYHYLNGRSSSNGIAVDTLGNAYVTGFVVTNVTTYGEANRVISKYDANGIEIWTELHPSYIYSIGYDIALDNTENIYEVGIGTVYLNIYKYAQPQ